MTYLIPSERRLRIHHSCLWQQHSPYEACSASYMALAPSVHIAQHILARVYHVHGKNCRSLCKSLNFFYLQAAAYSIIIPPASHFGGQITKKLKAERRLTHRWIHLIVVQNNLPSEVFRLVVPSHQLPIHQAGIGMLFSFFTYSSFPNIVLHISLAVGNIKLSAWLFGLSDTLADCLIKVCWPSTDFKWEILNLFFLSSEHGLSLNVVAALMVS